jgi:hypothetical protein
VGFSSRSPGVPCCEDRELAAPARGPRLLAGAVALSSACGRTIAARGGAAPRDRRHGCTDGQLRRRLPSGADALRWRWERIALAHRQSAALPPVVLRRQPDGYYVVDGRHRISVARALRQREIDAWVIGPQR